MNQYTQQLCDLQEKITRKAKLKDMLNSLRKNKSSLENEKNTLAAICKKEQNDVDKLEGISLPAIFYSITGQKEEHMEKERQEAYVAMTKYKQVCAQLKAVEQDIERYNDEFMELSSCEKEYEQLLKEKAECIKKTDTTNGHKLISFEEQLQTLKAQSNEIDEAYRVGVEIVNQIQSIKKSLDSAEGWGTWDLLGGGLITDMAKHSQLDDAQQKIQQLQNLLDRYKTELSDVQIVSEMQANIEGFLYFADFFFDGLFADCAVLDHIQNSQRQVEDTYRQVEQVQNKLNIMRNDIQSKIQLTQVALKQMIFNY